MRWVLTVRIAYHALGRNKLRSILTMLGAIIGIGTVIAVVAIGQGAQASIRAQIASLGADLLVVTPGATAQGGARSGWGGLSTLRAGDARAIQEECPAIAWATPTVSTRSQVVYTNQNWSTTLYGTGIEYPLIRAWPLRAGNWFTQQDVDAAAKVAVLGSTAGEMLFGGIDPVGQVIRVKNMPFQVLGLLASKGQ